MKKMLLMICILTCCLCAVAAAEPPASWHPANQVTVAWDPVGSEVGEISYKLYLQAVNLAGDTLVGDPLPVGNTAETTFVITLPEQGSYLVGVQSVLNVDGQQTAESPIGWSNDPAIATQGTFGTRYYLVDPAIGLRIGP